MFLYGKFLLIDFMENDTLQIHCRVGWGYCCQQYVKEKDALLSAICGGKFIFPIFDFIILYKFCDIVRIYCVIIYDAISKYVTI